MLTTQTNKETHCKCSQHSIEHLQRVRFAGVFSICSSLSSLGHRATLCFCIDPFNVCKHRKPRLGARAAWGQKNGAANRPAYLQLIELSRPPCYSVFLYYNKNKKSYE